MILYDTFYFTTIGVVCLLIIGMISLTHLACRKRGMLPIRYHFLIPHSLVFCVFYAVMVFAGIYEVYGFDQAQALTTFVIWNFYVISIQYAWGCRIITGEREPEIKNTSFHTADGDLKYFDNKYEVEFSKNESNIPIEGLNQETQEIENPYVEFDHEGSDKLDIQGNVISNSELKDNVFVGTSDWEREQLADIGMGVEEVHGEDWHEQDYWGSEGHQDVNRTWNGEENNENPFAQGQEPVIFPNSEKRDEEKDKYV